MLQFLVPGMSICNVCKFKKRKKCIHFSKATIREHLQKEQKHIGSSLNDFLAEEKCRFKVAEGTENLIVDSNPPNNEFITKDSGIRQDYASGMKRDVQTGKPRYGLIYKPLLKRWAALMTRGAEKYGDSNWQLADSKEELIRFMESGERHFQQFINLTKHEINTILKETVFNDVDEEAVKEDREEDHAAAVLFNIAAIEYLKDKFRRK